MRPLLQLTSSPRSRAMQPLLSSREREWRRGLKTLGPCLCIRVVLTLSVAQTQFYLSEIAASRAGINVSNGGQYCQLLLRMLDH
ncbi:hypothetical protein BDW72DRAFT_184894 [Aspergillus terricola var. indicus]